MNEPDRFQYCHCQNLLAQRGPSTHDLSALDLVVWCGGLRADHGQKHDPGDEISFRGDLTIEGPLQKHYSCILDFR